MSRLGERVRSRAWDAVRAARDRAFTPALRHDQRAGVLVLSPHLDDAVVDCWSVLTGDGRVTVLNVFDGSPPPGVLAHWDRLVRAPDSAALMDERRSEDRLALALAGREPVSLGLRADPYRSPRETPTLDRLDEAIRAAVPAAARVLAPAVLGTVHPDHLLVRSYALALATAGVPVELYADAPYAVQFGWPAWVTGDPEDPRLDPEVAWRASGAHLPWLDEARARVVALDRASAEAKLAAMRAYGTQFPMLDRGPVGQLSDPRVHGFEVFWPVPA